MIKVVDLQTGKTKTRKWKTKEKSNHKKGEKKDFLVNRRNQILSELDEIDRKTIRGLRANDKKFLEDLEKQAKKLRKELKEL